MINQQKIILFSSESFFNLYNDCFETFELAHFADIESFFKECFKVQSGYSNKEIQLDFDQNINDYYELILDNLFVFWIVEDPDNDYIMSIQKNLIMLRWMGFKQPIIISSFINLPGNINLLYKENNYNLEGLFKIKEQNDYFLRLPFDFDDLKALLKIKKIRRFNEKISYVRNNRSLIDHMLKGIIFSNKS